MPAPKPTPAPPAPVSAPPRVEVKLEPPKQSLDPKVVWAKILERASTRPSVRALFEGATLDAMDESRAIIRLREHEQLEFGRLNADAIAEMFRLETGLRLRIAFESATDEAPRTETRAITPEVRKQAEANELVRRTMELFDARVISVEDRAAPIKRDTTTTEGE